MFYTIILFSIITLWITPIACYKSNKIPLNEYFEKYGCPFKDLEDKYNEYLVNKTKMEFRNIQITNSLIEDISGVNSKNEFNLIRQNFINNKKLIKENNIKTMYDYVCFLEKEDKDIWIKIARRTHGMSQLS